MAETEHGSNKAWMKQSMAQIEMFTNIECKLEVYNMRIIKPAYRDHYMEVRKFMLSSTAVCLLNLYQMTKF